MSNIQIVDKNNAGSLGTKFILPKFTDDGVCTIENYEVSLSNTNDTKQGSNFVYNQVAFI